MLEGCRWQIEGGRDVFFGKDKWLNHDVDLINCAKMVLNEEESNRRVSEYIDEKGNWDWGKLKMWLPDNVCHMILSHHHPPIVLLGADSVRWDRTTNGNLKTKEEIQISWCSPVEG